MNATAENVTTTESQAIAAATTAGERIAPTWPLDQLIAVNPWWEMRDKPLQEVAAHIALLGHANGHMPREWFKEQFPAVIGRNHLEAAAQEAHVGMDAEALISWLDGIDQPPHWRNFSDQVDAGRDLERSVSWHDEIIHQISQFCASFYSAGTPLPAEPDRCLYEAWLESVRHDRGIEIMMGEHGLHKCFVELPETATELIEEAIAELSIDEDALEDYFHALLLDVNGWASWMAYVRWQDRLAGGSDDSLPELLAVRLAWELVLWRHQHRSNAGSIELMERQWRQQFAALGDMLQRQRDLQQPAWIWQRAAEIAYQSALHELLLQDRPAPQSESGRPVLQAALCIDVRSEVFRRALESQHPDIQTIGFAGFFGLPIEYAPAGASYDRPQLPGLLAPALTVTEAAADGSLATHQASLNRRARWAALSKAAPSSFGYVESVGLGYAFKLLRESFLGRDSQHPVNEGACEHSHFALSNAEGSLDAAAQAELAAGILGAMTLTSNFAPTVLLAGHGSSTRNNPHAAGLDCGACGGQTGEINVRVLAQLLNDVAVREALAATHSIEIPSDTQFVAALHDTTTDEMHCLTAISGNASGDEGGDVRRWLKAAGAAARAERAGKLGVTLENAETAIPARSRDWSQVRPEWGLAGNACFIVAPRTRTRHLNLGGRSFLHDYDWKADKANGYPVLELIMTAPMLVTHWIKMQYNCSVIDNERYGSGNKVLHNVVGGNLGVFEGNGGDLRIGLPLQSLHDGEQWMHDTLRLSVYIDAPAEAIADIARRHEVVRELLDNEWLYLFRLDDERGEIQRLKDDNWKLAASH